MSGYSGKLIVLYGVNNIGKTTQTALLVSRLKEAGKNAFSMKAPLYDLKPSGPMINEYLREGNPHELVPREAQILYAMNRVQYESELVNRLEQGEWIVFEDYWATSAAWGGASGVSLDFLIQLNEYMYPPDLNILMAGTRFLSSVEEKHKHERNTELADKAVSIFESLAKQYSWPVVSANQSIEQVHEDIWQIIVNRFKLDGVV
ncbi:MAG: hypothetical protein AAB691_02420 [Patescibacteria group bacterium]